MPGLHRKAAIVERHRARLDVEAPRAARAARSHRWDAAITATATALAAHTGHALSPVPPGRSHALTCLSEALSILAVHDLADRVAEDALTVARGSTARTAARQQLIRNRIVAGLDRELDVDPSGAASWHAGAHAAANSFSGTGAVGAAALALHEPGPRHLATLATRTALTADDAAILIIAALRCLVGSRGPLHLEQRANAATDDPRCHPIVRLALHRELAVHRSPSARTDATVSDLLTTLETEVRSRRGAHALALAHALAHHRLQIDHRRVTQQAMSDAVTGLPNRRAAEEYLDAVARARQPATVAVIDLDRFKSVNDRHSHTTGDHVLRAIADSLRHNLRRPDLFARYGGDEFVAVLPGTSLHDAATTFRRAAADVAVLPTGLGVTVSIGVASLPPGGTPADAIARADDAMYQVKYHGGNAVAVSPR